MSMRAVAPLVATAVAILAASSVTARQHGRLATAACLLSTAATIRFTGVGIFISGMSTRARNTPVPLFATAIAVLASSSAMDRLLAIAVLLLAAAAMISLHHHHHRCGPFALCKSSLPSLNFLPSMSISPDGLSAPALRVILTIGHLVRWPPRQTEDAACVETLEPASPTDLQKAQIRLAVTAATSLEEVQRLERALQERNFDVIARAAARAEALDEHPARFTHGARRALFKPPASAATTTTAAVVQDPSDDQIAAAEPPEEGIDTQEAVHEGVEPPESEGIRTEEASHGGGGRDVGEGGKGGGGKSGSSSRSAHNTPQKRPQPARSTTLPNAAASDAITSSRNQWIHETRQMAPLMYVNKRNRPQPPRENWGGFTMTRTRTPSRRV